MLHYRTAKLARWQVRLLVWSGAVLWLTGAGWLLLHHYGQRQGEFGPETNPLEPWMLRLHGAALIAALLGVGGLLVAHVWRGWQYRRQRAIGLALLVTVGLLVVTGYLLYYAGDEQGRPWISILHWAVGLASPVLFAWHHRAGRRIGRG